MSQKSKNPFHLWQELKQRKVVRVITVYTASALAVLQAADMVLPRIGFPSWTVTLVMILLGCGLVIAIVLSWIYDITPEGIKKTEDLQQIRNENNSGVEYVVHRWKADDNKSPEKGAIYNYELYSDKIQEFKKRGKIYSYSSVVVILAVIVLFTFSSANSVPFAKRDWVIITDFENITNDPVFDKSLYTAFSLSANQSRYINVFPRSRMLEAVTRMKLNINDPIGENTGREIAIREGIDIYIVPSISEVGHRYVIAAKIMEAKSGNILRSEVLNAENKDEILPKLDQLSKKIRRNLGESRYRIAAQDKPLKKVTTSSLEALKIYSQGIDHHLMMDFEGAKKFYENALKIDTGFTSAKASLGNLLIERFDPVKGRELLTLAVKSVDNLTERERLGILTFYAVNVEKNLPKGIEYAKTRIELYPDDAAARNNLGWYYLNSGRFEEALIEYKATVRIFPDMAFPYGGIGWIYLEKLGKLDSALVWAEKMISDIPENAYGYFYLGSAYLGFDSLSRAETAFRKAHEINPNLLMNEYRLAHTYRLQGRYNEAIEILKKIHDSHQDEQASTSYDMGINFQSMGNQKEAIKYFSEYKRIATEEWTKTFPNNPDTYFSIGSITARLGDFEASRKALRKAMEIDSSRHEKIAQLLCLQGNIHEALQETEKALENGYRDIVWLKINPDYQALQNEPRFRELLNKYFK
jgi:tetratricopeptide (TPR) repeat protein